MSRSIIALNFKRNILEVSNLYNSLDYGLDYVTIIEEDDGYKLVVRHQGQALLAKSYAKITEARDAFLEQFGSFRDDGARTIQPQWTAFFNLYEELDYLILCVINQQRVTR